MLNLPNKLYRGYELLKKSRVVKNKYTDGDSLQHFEHALNNTRPSTDEELVMHKVINGLYELNHNRFMKMILGTKAECFVLWCDASRIVRTFGLMQSVYIRKNKDHTFAVSVFQSRRGRERSVSIDSLAHPMANYLMDAFNDPGAEEKTEVQTDTRRSEISSTQISSTQISSTQTGSAQTNPPEKKEVAPLQPMILLSRTSSMKWGDICDDDRV